ncbi:hypothetical protein EBQ74_09600 [bacterium]|nr:hypothetical protein [bacterium]
MDPPTIGNRFWGVNGNGKARRLLASHLKLLFQKPSTGLSKLPTRPAEHFLSRAKPMPTIGLISIIFKGN